MTAQTATAINVLICKPLHSLQKRVAVTESTVGELTIRPLEPAYVINQITSDLHRSQRQRAVTPTAPVSTISPRLLSLLYSARHPCTCANSSYPSSLSAF